MGRKRKKRRGAGAGTPRDTTSGELDHRPFAGRLSEISKARQEAEQDQHAQLEAERRARRAVLEEAAASRRSVVGAEALRRGERVEMTDEELFAAAVSDLDAVKIHEGKYGGRGPVTRHVQPKAPRPDRPEDPYDDAQMLFESEFMLGEVERLDEKYHVPEPGKAIEVEKLYKLSRQRQAPPPAEGESRAEAVEAITGDHIPTLTRDQLRLLEESARAAERAPLLATNLRGMTRDPALAALKVAVEQAHAKGNPYIRVITGKGLQSVGEPVLKITLVEWCTAMSLRYAPELLPDGSFGAFVVHVPRRRKP